MSAYFTIATTLQINGVGAYGSIVLPSFNSNSIPQYTKTIVGTGVLWQSFPVSVPITTATTLSLNGLANIGAVQVINNDATNFLTYGCVSGHIDFKVPPLGNVVFIPTTNTIYLLADTAALTATVLVAST